MGFLRPINLSNWVNCLRTNPKTINPITSVKKATFKKVFVSEIDNNILLTPDPT